jgi:hypothetical protein
VYRHIPAHFDHRVQAYLRMTAMAETYRYTK